MDSRKLKQSRSKSDCGEAEGSKQGGNEKERRRRGRDGEVVEQEERKRTRQTAAMEVSRALVHGAVDGRERWSDDWEME